MPKAFWWKNISRSTFHTQNQLGHDGLAVGWKFADVLYRQGFVVYIRTVQILWIFCIDNVLLSNLYIVCTLELK